MLHERTTDAACSVSCVFQFVTRLLHLIHEYSNDWAQSLVGNDTSNLSGITVFEAKQNSDLRWRTPRTQWRKRAWCLRLGLSSKKIAAGCDARHTALAAIGLTVMSSKRSPILKRRRNAMTIMKVLTAGSLLLTAWLALGAISSARAEPPNPCFELALCQ